MQPYASKSETQGACQKSAAAMKNQQKAPP